MDASVRISPSLVHSVVMLANGHPTYDTRIFVKEAVTLKNAGYEVCIILPAPESTTRENIRIIALPNPSTGWKKLVLNPWNVLKAALRQPKGSVFVMHDSTILLVGVVLKVCGRKVIYDAHEDTPLQISYQHWLPPLTKKIYAWGYYLLEKFCGWIFNYIIVAEPVISKYFPKRKTALIRNFPIAHSFRAHPPVSYRTREKRLVNVGTLSEVRGVLEMAKSALAARKHVDFEFVLGGSFSPASLREKVLPHYPVNFLGWVSYDELVHLLFHSQVGIIITHPVERYKTNYPVKLFEFMAAGLPVIASKDTEAAKFVQEANCGILVDPLNVEEISAAIVWLFSNPGESEAMGLRGQRLIFDKYNWEKESEMLLEVIGKLILN
jgi:glycosyltransferase involved in cell wall biosynthesis